MNEVIRTVGVPKELVSDGTKAELHGRFAKAANKYKIKQQITEPYCGWQNRAEAAIRDKARDSEGNVACTITKTAIRLLW